MTNINQERLVEHFIELVKIDSESGNEKAVAEVLAEQLAEHIAEAHLDYVVSGCPSCRDGISLQSTLRDSDIAVGDIYDALLRNW